MTVSGATRVSGCRPDPAPFHEPLSIMGTSQGVWFVFGFCGFGQLPGSGHGHQVLRPERLPDSEVRRVSAGWSYTAVLTREHPNLALLCVSCLPGLPYYSSAVPAGSGHVHLSGSVDGVASGCRDVWASEELLVLLRSRSGPGPRTELQAWMPAKALRGEPLWTRLLDSEGDSERDPGGNGDRHPGLLPLLPGARAYVSPQPPHYLSLGPELRARRVELGTEHVLLLDEAGQVFSWGAGRYVGRGQAEHAGLAGGHDPNKGDPSIHPFARHGQLGHGTLEPTSEPRLLEALQGLRMATVAAGGWHSVCVSGERVTLSLPHAGQAGEQPRPAAPGLLSSSPWVPSLCPLLRGASLSGSGLLRSAPPRVTTHCTPAPRCGSALLPDLLKYSCPRQQPRVDRTQRVVVVRDACGLQRW